MIHLHSQIQKQLTLAIKYIKNVTILLLITTSGLLYSQVDIGIVPLPPKDNPIGYHRDSLVSWVERILHGGGGVIDTASITFTGNREALGRFYQGNDIGFGKGLIISNGKVVSAEAPNTIGAKSDAFNVFDPFSSSGDEDLLNMYNTIFAGTGGRDTTIFYTGDAAVLEFDYQPYGDQILMDYTFASEEYPSAGVQPPTDVDLTGFNGSNQIFDLFGISIEKYGFHNLAFMIEDSPTPTPEETRWITVQNVNESNNSSYYQPNPEDPPLGRVLGTQYDGVTKTEGDLGPLFIQRKDVDPCGVYHVKIAIEDFYWESPDPEQIPSGFEINSALFLGEKSLISNIQQSGVQYSNYSVEYEFLRPELDGQLVENCNHIIATFTLDDSVAVVYSIPYKIQLPEYYSFVEVSYEDGTIITNDSITFLPGETEITINIKAINLDNNYPSVAFTYPINPCDVPGPWGGGYTGRINFDLTENKPITFSVTPKIYEAFCKETIELTITDISANGVDPLFYYWDGDIVSKDTINYQVQNSPDYVDILVKDHCDNEANGVIQINNKSVVLEQIADAFLCGPGQSVNIPAVALQPDFNDYTIDHVKWYKLNPYQDLGEADGNIMTVLYDDVVGDGIWTCGYEITDCCGGTQTGSFLVNQSELTLGNDVWICKGGSKELSVNAEAQSFEWYATNNPSVILSYSSSVIVSPEITTEYTLQILDLCGVVQTASIIVNVDLFEPQITIDTITAEICAGDEITLTANDANEWTWNPDGATTQSITINPIIPGVYTYILTASSDYCIDKQVTASFEVFPIPVANFNYDPFEDLCTGETIDFSYSEAVTNEIFEWNFDDGSGTSSLANPSHVYNNPGNYDVTLHVDKYICNNDTSIQVIINPLPNPDFTSDVVSGCLPVEVVFDDLSTDIQSNAVYEWEFGDGETSSADGNTSHTYTQAGVYTVSLTVNNTERCEKSVVKQNYVFVNPNPEAGFTPDPPITTMDTPTINFINTSQSDSTIVTYEWDFDDGSGILTGEENPSHLYDMAGDYDVVLFIETNNGCYDYDTVRVALTEEAVLFIPNAFTPNNDGINDVFEIKGTSIADYNLYIYNRWGQVIWSTHNFEISWDGTNRSGEKVAPGSYIYKITGTDYLKQSINYQGMVTVLK